MNQIETWITELIQKDELEKFYKSAIWLKTAQKVKELDNFECQMCKAEGKVTTCGSRRKDGKPVQISVHHKKEVRKHPELALSIWYEDGSGERQRNLITICETHHNRVHGKFKKQKAAGFLNEERW